MNVLEVLCLCAFNLLSFVIGAKIGQLSAKNKDISLNPVKTIKEEIKESKITRKEDLKKRQIDTMLDNIDNYNGTGLGQKQIPKD